MDDLAMVRVADAQGDMAVGEFTEPIADMNFNRKKMLHLEHSVGSLQKAARQHNEVVSALESTMKAMISETDLRRAIGLAFQEFEQRLEDAFQDSNRKCLQMFSRRDDVVELEGTIAKKVNWSDYNNLMKRVTDLRAYIDTMAESVFIGHREALNSEFAKKADKVAMEQALSVKADSSDVHEVQARLERLEVLVAHTDARHTSALEALREEADSKRRALAEQHMAAINETTSGVAKLKDETKAIKDRLTSAEGSLQAMNQPLQQAREGLRSIQQRLDDQMMPTMKSMQAQLDKLDSSAKQMQQDFRTMQSDAGAFNDSVQKSMAELRTQVKASKDHSEFLLEELEVIKRRSQERHKKNTASFQEITEGQEQLSQQLKSIERDMKKQGRDMRAIDNRAAKAIAADDHSALAGLRALTGMGPTPPLPLPFGVAPPAGPDITACPNDKLRTMLEQIEKIAHGGPITEHFGTAYNPERPPLPIAGVPARPPIAGAGVDGAESARLPRFNSMEPAPIDSARSLSAGAKSATVQGMYGLSPRLTPTGGRAGRKKR